MMSFVRENIDTSERRAELASLNLMSPLTRRSADSKTWFVDRERGLYFINFGGGSAEIPFLLGLADRNGFLLSAEGRDSFAGDYYPKNVDVTWQIESLSIPKRLSNRATEILLWFQEALRDYGSMGNVEVVRSVQATLPDPKFV